MLHIGFPLAIRSVVIQQSGVELTTSRTTTWHTQERGAQLWASGQARRPRAVMITASERICGRSVAPVSLPKSDTGQRSA
jgi:hypothetical protein